VALHERSVDADKQIVNDAQAHTQMRIRRL
jgi:hypothetical protein